MILPRSPKISRSIKDHPNIPTKTERLLERIRFIAKGNSVIYLATHSNIRSRKGIAMEGLWWAKVESTTMHKLRVSSSNCSSDTPQSGHQSRSRSPSTGSLSTLLSRVLSKERVERPCTSLGLEPFRYSLTEMDPSILPDRVRSSSRVSLLVVESIDTRKKQVTVSYSFSHHLSQLFYSHFMVSIIILKKS